ncbi:hypothetical protein BDN72DRAFT_847647 [Pluteus cervinus]|uniref:Uncharacterized protein n=1 Tax=Pluteus cervinus TaxID=181527 RepID=A0ACD3ABY1_9AGAR|nr:hypothetical protein BDN72DRAFT_847647 [Pluteus cervinus]
MATDIAQANITNLAPETHPKVDDVAGNEKRDKVVRALISAFDNKEITAHFGDEIKNMAKTTREIKRGFEQVSQDLKPFDDRKFTKADGSPVAPLRLIWDGYYEEYKTLLRTSREDAMNLKLICDHYLELVVPALEEPTVSARELKDIAVDYKEQTIPHDRTSKFYTDIFGSLSRRMTNFQTIIKDALSGAKGGITADISKLEGQVQELRDEINRHRELISNLVKKAEEDERAWEERAREERHSFGYRITSLFQIVAPVTLKPHFNDAHSAERNKREGAIQDKESVLAPLESQLVDLKRQQHDFPELERTLGACDGKIGSIALKVGAIGEFWNAVNMDAEMIIKKLNIVLASNSASGLFALRQELGERGVAAIYISLRDALTHYTFEATV